jgi:hypothetical protein
MRSLWSSGKALGLVAAEEFQLKLQLLLNSQMFVQGFDTENRPAILLRLLSSLNRQMFVLGFDKENRPAILLLLLSSLNLLKEKDLLKRDRKLFPAKGKVAQGI